MTLPNGASGVVADIEWAVQYGSLGGLASRTQDAVMAALQAEVQASQAWNRATAAVWADLRRGISLVHAIIEAMVQRLLDTVEEFPGVAEALNAIQKVPGEAPLVAALTGVPGDLDDAAVYLSQQWSDLEWVATQLRNLLNAAGQLAGGDVGGILATVQSDLQSLVTQSVGSGGSGFPWTFPISFGTGSGFPWSFPIAFGDVQKDLSDVGSAILNAPQSGQQVLNTIVRSVTGVQSTVDHSLADLETAVAQLPASPPLATVATGLQQAAGTASQMGAIIQNAGQQTAAQVGGALATAGASATSAVNQLQDAAVNAIGGAAPAVTQYGAALAGAFGLWVNAATGSAVAAAAAQDVAGAFASGVAAQSQAAVNITGLQASIVGLYGGGVGGLKAQETFPGGVLPTDFTSIGNGLAANTAVYNVATAQGDAQTVVGIWSSPPAAGKYYYLFLRGNALLTTFSYLKIGVPGIEFGCFVGGVKTVFAPLNSFYHFDANQPYSLTVDGSYNFNFVGYDSGGNKQTQIYSDSLHVSQIGSGFRTGGFGTDEAALPGVITAWDFFDEESFGPAAAFVAAAEAVTGNTTYVDLGTITDTVTVDIGPLGMAQVFLSANVANNTATAEAFMAFAMSGANTAAANDNYAIMYQAFTANGQGIIGAPFLLTGLAAGATTFKAKYRVSSGTGTFTNRRIAVTPL